VFITGRRQKELDEAVKGLGNNVVGVRGDVSKLHDLDSLYGTVTAKGRIDVLVANAGIGEFAPLASLTEEHFDRLFDLNVKGTLFTVQKALTLMNDGGSIILIGSVASVKGTAAFGTYGATKAAVRNLVRTWTPTKSPRQHSSWPQTIQVLSRASNCSSMVAEVKFDQLKRSVAANTRR
jgi:NAD(P)-dependent dehydrogenase (short-subunit alcohol dehydrogenase family)